MLWERRGGDMSHKQRRGGKMGRHVEVQRRKSHSGGPRLMYAHREQWPSLALTCLWLMSTGQWFCSQRLHPCSRALSFGALGLETVPADATRVLLGGTWVLLPRASPHIFPLPPSLHVSIITSHTFLAPKMARLAGVSVSVTTSCCSYEVPCRFADVHGPQRMNAAA